MEIKCAEHGIISEDDCTVIETADGKTYHCNRCKQRAFVKSVGICEVNDGKN
jgi:hypothetical protein